MLVLRETIDSLPSVIRYIRNYSVDTTHKPLQFLASRSNRQFRYYVISLYFNFLHFSY